MARPHRPIGRPWRLLPLLLLGLTLGACNPLYVARAGWAQAGILSSREPLTQVLTAPETDQETRGKLRLIRDARHFAIQELGFQGAGDAYTTVAELPSDTLALVLTAAYRDRLEFRTWWFPIVGHVPYRAYFSTAAGEQAQRRMEADGYDTFLRPTAAFSTLGWFSDPVYSTVLRQDQVGAVETILHELAHNHLFIPGQGRFNESWATFAGHAAAIQFFCTRDGGGPDTTWCRRARDRWADARQVSRFLMELETDIREIYEEEDLPAQEILELRDQRYQTALEAFRSQVQPSLKASSYGALAQAELNNATLLSRVIYFHRLDDFHRLWKEDWAGDLEGLVHWIRTAAPEQPNPFQVLELPISGS